MVRMTFIGNSILNSKNIRSISVFPWRAVGLLDSHIDQLKIVKEI